jgi:hypothetical protein
MDLIQALVTGLLLVVAACLGNSLADDLRARLPSHYATLVRLAVRRAPPHLRERLAEEWGAHLNDMPDNLGKLLLALDLFRASGTLRRDVEAVDAEHSASEQICDTEFLDSMQRVICGRAPAARAVETVGAASRWTFGVVSGWDALGYELRQEQAATIGRLARELRDALGALDDFDQRARRANAAADNPALQRVRARLIDTAADALWHFVVQRDCMGFRQTEEILEDYAVPAAVRARMGATRTHG